MRKIESLLEKIYERNPINGNYIIEVALTDYAGIFNDWDHAPYKRKDIHPELLGFLEDSIDDIPMPYNIDICFYLAQETQNKDRELVISAWFKTFYTFYIEIEKAKIKSIVQHAIKYMIVSIGLLVFSYFSVLFKSSLIIYTLKEVVIVGGWVFLWEAIAKLIFERKTVVRVIKNYQRFISADISFRYSKHPQKL